MARFERVRTAQPDVQALQENVAAAVEPLLAVPFLDGLRLEGVELASGLGGNQVAHKLGRKPLGWKLLRVRAQATVWDDQDNNEAKAAILLKLHASAAVTVDLWVF